MGADRRARPLERAAPAPHLEAIAVDERTEIARGALASSAEGRADEAVDALKRLIHDDPAHPIWRMRLADVLARDLRPDAARDQRTALCKGARAAGRPLEALVAALAGATVLPGDSIAEWLTRVDAPPTPTAATPPPPPLPPARPPIPTPLPLPPEGTPLPDYPSQRPRSPRKPIPLLSLLDRRAFDLLVGGLSRVALAPGGVLFEEGALPDGMYLVAAGQLEAVRLNAEHRYMPVARLGPGTVVGEMGLVLTRPRSATIRALTFAEIIRIDLAAVVAMAKAHPQVGETLIAQTQVRLLGLMLAQSPLFGELALSVRESLLRRFETLDVPEDAVLVEQGDAGSTLYVVVSGEVEVVRTDEAGAQSRVAELGSGQIFGEISLLTGEPATASVVATQDTRLLALTRKQLVGLCRAHPEIEQRLSEISADRIDEIRFLYDDEDFIEDAD